MKVLRKKDEVRKESGIIIPEVANAALQEGLVKMVDEAIKEFVPVGNIVIFPEKTGSGQYLGNEPLLWLEMRDIWATFSIDEE